MAHVVLEYDLQQVVMKYVDTIDHVELLPLCGM